MAQSETDREKARERTRRYLARKRGEDVPKRKAGRPKIDTSALSRLEDLARAGSTAAFVGTEDGFNVWMLFDKATGDGKVLRFAAGPETHTAISKLLFSQLTFGVMGHETETRLRLAELIDETLESLAPIPPDTPMVIPGLFWSPYAERITLRIARDYFQHGHFVPFDGAIYNRVDGSKIEEGGGSQDQLLSGTEGAPGLDADQHDHGGDDDAQP
jgi:hypothetical protein